MKYNLDPEIRPWKQSRASRLINMIKPYVPESFENRLLAIGTILVGIEMFRFILDVIRELGSVFNTIIYAPINIIKYLWQ